MTRTVVIPVFSGVQLIDFVGPLDVFDAAGRIAGTALYDCRVASSKGGLVSAAAGMAVESSAVAEFDHTDIDLLLVPGTLDVEAMLDDREHLETVDRLARHAATSAAVCTGAFVLAQLGMLDGRTAATHWAFASQLSRRYPETTVDAERLFIRDGNVLTCGGAASGIDLALHIVEGHHGRELARETAKWLVVYLQRPGTQSQFGAQTAIRPSHEPSVQRAVDAIVADPTRSHTVDELAAGVGVSRRHFARLFRRDTGTTPAKFVERTRVELARSLLETTDARLSTIADSCGFSSAEMLRQVFGRHYGVSPTHHRSTFGSPDSTSSEVMSSTT